MEDDDITFLGEEFLGSSFFLPPSFFFLNLEWGIEFILGRI